MFWNKQDSDPPQTGPVQPIKPSASFYVKIEGEEGGPYPTQALRKVPRFTLQTPLREMGSEEWKPAFLVIDLPTYFADPTPTDPMAAAAARTQIDEILSCYPRHRRSTARRSAGRMLLWLLPCLGASAFYLFAGKSPRWRDPAIQAAIRLDFRLSASRLRRWQNSYGPKVRHLLSFFPIQPKKPLQRKR